MKTVKIGLSNQKGGVGKSTSAINFAYNWRKEGFKVLVVDCDPQCNSFLFFKRRYAEIIQSGGAVTTWESYKSYANTDFYHYVIFDMHLKTNGFRDVQKIFLHIKIVILVTEVAWRCHV